MKVSALVENGFAVHLAGLLVAKILQIFLADCETNYNGTRMWANANPMVALPNIGGALCSTPQSLADAHY